MLDLYQFIKPVNMQSASDWKGLFGIRKNNKDEFFCMFKSNAKINNYQLERDTPLSS